VAWALERAANPTVLRLHTTVQATGRTIETCPPAFQPLRQPLAIPAVRSVDMHRYLARLNLTADADPEFGSTLRCGSSFDRGSATAELGGFPATSRKPMTSMKVRTGEERRGSPCQPVS
jgi:hypothetical protein